MAIHISFDLETWGTTPGSDIRSIGACVFDPLTSDIAERSPHVDYGSHFYIACDNPIVDDVTFDRDDPRWHTHWDSATQSWRKYPLTRDPQTVQWWNDQSDDARAAFSDPVDLRDALIRFALWFDKIATASDVANIGPGNICDGRHVTLWSHGAAFDAPILAAAYAAVGLPVPWHYRAPRDTRTAFDMAGITDHSAHLARFTTGTHHHALDDAICQARAVCDAYSTVRAWADAQLAAPCPPVLDGDTLRQRAIAAVTAYDDWTNHNETVFIGWGDMIVPPGATLWRKNSGEALRLLTADNPHYAPLRTTLTDADIDGALP